ncbi:RNA-directed DNA polymerase, eukaryota, reverse transcriptase zinc-binding domain protein [Tanacetum coccineum]
MESIRSRFFNGIDVNEKKSSWFSWNKVLASKDKGGLGVSSFYAMNRALMFKWVWRFRTDNSSLWARFIKAMHGEDSLLGKSVKSFAPSIWLDIIRDLNNLKNQGIDLLGLIKKNIGNGCDTSFWEDTWKGDTALKSLFPRVFKLETCKHVSVAFKLAHASIGFSLRRPPRGGAEFDQFCALSIVLNGLQHPNMKDRWFWSLSGTSEFTAASARQFIDDHLLPDVSFKFSWRKIVPIKVNILAWKIKLNFLPSRLNLSRRGLDIPTIMCPICEKYAKSTNHIFYDCYMVRDIYRKIASWWDVSSPQISSYEEWEAWISSLNFPFKRKLLMEGVFYIAWWTIWNFRNKLVFGSTIPSKSVIFDDIVARSFQWCKHRGRFNFSWIDWLKNPSLVIM